MPDAPGLASLATIRATIRQRADMVYSTFVADAELNGWINSSAFELYDVLVQKFGADYYVTSLDAATDGGETVPLPAAFYKLLGVDVLDGDWRPLRPFNFGERHRHSPAGLSALRYRLAGNALWLNPTPAAKLSLRIWYVPRLAALVDDTDTLDGVSGWEEYVVVDCAIKAKRKEESDVSVEMAQKAALLARIESAAANRDAGSPATVVDVYGDSPRDWPEGFHS
jgi:hypothetical protein